MTDERLKRIKELFSESEKRNGELAHENFELKKRIAELEEIDIVRCGECRRWKRKEDAKYGFCHACQHGYLSNRWDISIERKTKESHYCADAIRRE